MFTLSNISSFALTPEAQAPQNGQTHSNNSYPLTVWQYSLIFKSCWTKCLMNLLRLHTTIQHQPLKIHGILVSFIHKFLFTNSYLRIQFYHCIRKRAEESLILVMLPELMDSNDEKPSRGKIRSWIKRSSVSGYFNNTIPELMIAERMGFKEMFQISAESFVEWKPLFNQSNMKIMLDEAKKFWIKFLLKLFFIQHDFFSFFGDFESA